jgi:hypothetical protein
LVVQIDYDSVALRDIEQRKRPLIVDGHDRSLCHAIRIGIDPANVPVKGNSICKHAWRAERQYWNQEV